MKANVFNGYTLVVESMDSFILVDINHKIKEISKKDIPHYDHLLVTKYEYEWLDGVYEDGVEIPSIDGITSKHFKEAYEMMPEIWKLNNERLMLRDMFFSMYDRYGL